MESALYVAFKYYNTHILSMKGPGNTLSINFHFPNFYNYHIIIAAFSIHTMHSFPLDSLSLDVSAMHAVIVKKMCYYTVVVYVLTRPIWLDNF